jgi:hypothetical protein
MDREPMISHSTIALWVLRDAEFETLTKTCTRRLCGPDLSNCRGSTSGSRSSLAHWRSFSAIHNEETGL